MSGYEELIAGNGPVETPVAEAPPAVDAPPEPQAAPEPAPVSETPPAPVQAEPAAPSDPMAPVKALLDERDKRQAAEREVARYRAQEAERARQHQEEAQAQAPDIFEDPEGYRRWSEARTQALVREAVAHVQRQQHQATEELSRTMMERHLGAEKFDELAEFIDAAPDQAHAIARKQADPYGWFYGKFQQALKARQAETALKSLGDKSLDERIAEATAAAVAEARVQWDAERAQPAAQSDGRARNPDGTFASPSQAQRHQPPSLAVVPSAAAPRGSEIMSGYDALIQKRG